MVYILSNQPVKEIRKSHKYNTQKYLHFSELISEYSSSYQCTGNLRPNSRNLALCRRFSSNALNNRNIATYNSDSIGFGFMFPQKTPPSRSITILRLYFKTFQHRSLLCALDAAGFYGAILFKGKPKRQIALCVIWLPVRAEAGYTSSTVMSPQTP
jgi:hypothetical protein